LSFDARTLLVIGGLLSWTLAAVIEFQAVRPNRGQVLPDPWTLGLLAKGLGLNLLSQRGLVSDLWSISVANSLLLLGPLFCYAALQRVRGVPTNFLLIAAVPIGVGVLLPIIGFAPEQFPARTAVFTGAGLFGFCLNCWSASQLWRSGYKAGATLILGTSAVLATIAVAHAVAVMSGGIGGLFGGNRIQIALYTINAACIAISTFGYMDILRRLRDRQTGIDPDLLPDPLTGLYSRPSFIGSGQAELARARMRGQPASVMKIQIDGFEPLNATHGRAFADRQLKRVASTIQMEIRNFDIAGRLSADTIGVMMPELNLLEGYATAERIRAAVEAEQAVHNGVPLRVTISTGLCTAEPDEHTDIESAMALAAACLHRAHLAGGNQITTPASVPSKEFVEGTI
jgi:diguanylate cyclase (GGDEF)-like protein